MGVGWVHYAGSRRNITQSGGTNFSAALYGHRLIWCCSGAVQSKWDHAKMKKIFAIAWKDAIIRFASPSELLFFIVLPLIFTFLLAGGTPSGDEDPRIGLVAVDEANTAISEQIIRELENSTAVRSDVVSRDEAQSLFDERRADVVLIIPAGIDM